MVSIHAPREGCDLSQGDHSCLNGTFQFTHPGRGATNDGYLTHIGRYTFQFTHPGRGATGGVMMFP